MHTYAKSIHGVGKLVWQNPEIHAYRKRIFTSYVTQIEELILRGTRKLPHPPHNTN